MEARTTCFISFMKLLFSVLKKRKTIYEVLTVNSHNSETVNHIAQLIFVLHTVHSAIKIIIIIIIIDRKSVV